MSPYKEAKISIKDLAQHKQYVPLVSKWAWQEWSRKENTSLKEVIYRTRYCLTKTCPRTFIAFYNGCPAGTAALWPTDYRMRFDLGPWLANLYIAPRYRRRGLGQALQAVVLKAAQEAGFKKIYLITELKGYYEKTGWRFIETGPYKRTETIRIYEHKISH